MKKESTLSTSFLKGFMSFIRQHPLVMFFSMSLLFMWVIDFVMVGLLKQDGYTYTLIAAFTPVLSAMLLMTVIHPGKVKTSPRNRIITFFVVLIVAGVVRWISRIWWEHDLSWRVLPGDAVLVLLTAFVASSAFSGRKSIRTLLQPMINWKVNWKWYVFSLLFWPALTLVGNLFAVLLKIPVPEAPRLPDAPIFLVIPVSFVWAFFFNGTMGEEGGWRGFALPRLQSRFSPLVASIILGFFWGAFHWSGFFIGYKGNAGSFWIRLGDIALAIIFTWLYNRLKGKSLLPLLLLHASMNATSTDFLPRARLTVYSLLGIVVLVMIFKDRMWKRQPEIKANSGSLQAEAFENKLL